MSEEQDLKIRIQTIADASGLKMTNDELERTVNKVREMDGATGKTASAVKGLGDAQRAAGTAAGQMGDDLKNASAASQGLATGFDKLHFSGRAITHLFHSLASGNILGVFTSLIHLVHGVAAALGVAALAAAPLVLAIMAMKRESHANEEAMKKMWEEGAAKSEEYKKHVEAVKKASDIQLKAMADAVKHLDEQWKELLGDMAAAEGRMNKIHSAEKALASANIDKDEATALRNAKPGQAEGIKAAYAIKRELLENNSEKVARDNEELKAKLTITNAEEAQRKVSSLKSRAQIDAETAERNFGKGSPEAIAARERRKTINTETEKIEKETDKTIYQSKTDLDVINIARKTDAIIATNRLNKTIAPTLAEGPTLQEAQKAARDAAARGDSAGQDMAVAAIRGIAAAAKKADAALALSGDEAVKAYKDIADTAAKNAAAWKALRESRPSGG